MNAPRGDDSTGTGTVMVPVEEWAARRYRPAPSTWVLRRWCRDGEIEPAAEKVSGVWYVAQDAVRRAAE